jgi:hypothetical protein
MKKIKKDDTSVLVSLRLPSKAVTLLRRDATTQGIPLSKWLRLCISKGRASAAEHMQHGGGIG